MTETRVNKGVQQNRTGSDSEAGRRPILDQESDAFIGRLKDIIGTESNSSFARRCGFKESVLRGYLAEGKKPGMYYLVAIANAGAVNMEWLATGRGPKTRAELRAAQVQAQYQAAGEPASVARIDHALLRQCLAACTIVYGAPFAASAAARQLEHAAAFYNALLPNIGPGLSLQEIAARDARSLADTLRGLISLGAIRPFA